MQDALLAPAVDRIGLASATVRQRYRSIAVVGLVLVRGGREGRGLQPTCVFRLISVVESGVVEILGEPEVVDLAHRAVLVVNAEVPVARESELGDELGDIDIALAREVVLLGELLGLHWQLGPVRRCGHVRIFRDATAIGSDDVVIDDDPAP